jgi:hypothetical protein
MKKQLLLVTIAMLTLCGGAYAQGYYYFKLMGTTSEYVMNQTGAAKITTGPSTNNLSAASTLPFAWNFFGSAVTEFKASTSGYITFDATQTASVNVNTALSGSTAPNKSIFAFWDDTKLEPITQGSNTFASDITTWTYGTAPKRVCVIQWRLVQAGAVASTNVTYYAIRLYEGGDFDIVHNYGFGTFSASAGVRNADGTVVKEITGTPSLSYGGNNGSYDVTKSDVYKFTFGTQSPNEVQMTSLDLPSFSQKNSNIQIKGKITSYGATNLSSFKLYYSVNGGAAVTMQLSGLNIANSGGTYNFAHNAPYTNSTPGNYPIKVWVSDPNAGVDGDTTNNSATGTLTIVNSTVPRKVLHEIFTSSTCPPCNPGNVNLDNILAEKVGTWTAIKYQANFPGTGDPYYTSEVGTRFSFYGASFAPWLVVDGSSKWGASTANSNSYTAAFYDAKAAVPSLASITANFVRAGNKVTVSGNVTPVQSFTNSGLKLRIAIVESKTNRNIKTNGETEFYNVMKKMLPNAAGTTVSFTAGTAVAYTQTYTFSGAYRLPADGQAANIINLATENSVEEFGNLFAIVFLEDDNDKTVWQSASSAPDGALAVNEVSELGLNLYPNPAKNSFEVTFNGSSSNGSVRIIDMNGREVLTQNVNSLNGLINCDNLINGLYFVELTVDGKTAVKKLNVIR